MASVKLEDLPLRFAYRRHPDQDAATPARHPVVIVGAGPVGLALAIDLAPGVSPRWCSMIPTGSAREAAPSASPSGRWRSSTGSALAKTGGKGITWQRGRVFLGERELYDFDLLPEAGHRRPAFINIQQYYVEAALAARAAGFPDLIDLRWSNRLAAVARPGPMAPASPSTRRTALPPERRLARRLRRLALADTGPCSVSTSPARSSTTGSSSPT